MTEAEKPIVKRDISWLSFNHRVLQEAADPTVPLYERLKFLAIYSSNLDEFYRVRVASLLSFRKLAKPLRREMELKPRKLLRQIRQIVQDQQVYFGQIFQQILAELEKRNIHLVMPDQMSDTQISHCLAFFEEKIRPHLQLEWIDPASPVQPFLENRSIYLVIVFEGEHRLGLVKLPVEHCGRFLVLPTQPGHLWVTFTDEVLRLGLPQLFPGQTILGSWAVKLSRDAELYIEDEYSGDLLEKIRQGLKDRHVGLPTRLLYDADMPAEVLLILRTCLDLSKNDVIPGARYHNFHDFFSFPLPPDADGLLYEPLPPLPVPDLDVSSSVLASIAQADRLFYFPYQRFDYLLRLLEEAAVDPQVEYIKITLYRVAPESAVGNALIHALERGKQVVVFIEAKARFDEESNLNWGERLERAGATVRYSFPGIKVHAKLLLIGRREGGQIKHYAWLGTGNFNEKTATLYTDFALLTADPRLADEVARVFDLLEGRLLLPPTKHLLVAPFTLKDQLIERIDREIHHARSGHPAGINLKLNSLEHPVMIDKLIEASRAGVPVRLIIRGICCLLPGVEGFSDRIRGISIVDRFLEHARIYWFHNDGEEEVFLASADWMQRNLDRRVEVAFPVYEKKLREKIKGVFETQWRDTLKARILDASMSNRYVREENPEAPPLRSQYAIFDLFVQG